MHQRQVVCGAIVMAMLGGACAVAQPPTAHPGRHLAQPAQTRWTTETPALARYANHVQEQLVPRCEEQLSALPSASPRAHAAEHATVQIGLALREDGEVGLARLVSASGDDAVDQVAVKAAASLRYLPPVPAELSEQHVSLRMTLQLDRGTQTCAVRVVRLIGLPMSPPEVLALALSRGHYARAQEIVIENGARPDVIALLEKTIQARRTSRPRASYADARELALTQEEILLQSAQRVAAVSPMPHRHGPATE